LIKKLKQISIASILYISTYSFASDAITIDSIFKNSSGLRSITSLQFLASSGSKTYITYPALVSVNDGNILVDSKTTSLNETLLYSYNSKIDLILNANGSYENQQYVNSNGFADKDSTNFNSVWMGFNYQLDSILGEFKPAIEFQIPIFEKYHYQNKSASNSLKAFSTKFSLRNYSDPLVSSFYISVLKNFEKNVGDKKVQYPDSYAIGFDMSLILNQRASLNFNFAQRYQTPLKENSQKVNPSITVPTMGLGATYSISENNSFTISSSIGSSANSPDSIITASLWHKF
jgi:hypothetical protein